MSWIAVTLLSAALIGLIGVLDKAFLHHFARSYRTLPLLIGLAHAPIGIVFIATSNWDDLTVGAVGWSLLAGIFWALNAIVLFRVMAKREVSRTLPVVQSFPIFVAPIAVIFLGEHLRLLDWFAIVVTVLGAVMISMRANDSGRGIVVDRAFYQLLGGSLLLAGMSIASKQAVETLPVFLAHGIRSVGFAVVLLAFTFRAEPVNELGEMIRQRSPALGIFGANEFLVANTGMLLSLWAISLGPVSLVTALAATSSLFLLVYSTLLALRFKGMLGEQITRRAVAVKTLAIGLIVAGVATISLG